MPQAHPAAVPKLVVADDEEGLLFLMVDALRREGYEVEGFETGQLALEWLSRERADLLLLDLKLTDLPAPELVAKLRQLKREVPFIIITGHGDERTAVEIMKQGALDYVMKESGVLDLLPDIVRRALDIVLRDRKLADATEAIRQREELQRKILQTALDGFVRLDAGGKILEVNDAVCELLGCSTGELAGENVLSLKTTTSADEWQQRYAELREQGFVRCFTGLRLDGPRQIDVEISMRADGEEFFGFVHDLSAQRRLEREVLQVGEEERRRFGAELHDNLGQQLTALELMSTTLARDLSRIAPALVKPANGIAQCARKMIAQTRQLAHGLAPLAFGAEGLRAALDDLARVTSATGVECRFRCEPPVQLPPLEVSTHLYRIAQEAINNALKHAKAKRIDVTLSSTDDRLELSIADHGRGFSANYEAKAGMGLRILHHRARLIGAQLQIQSSPKKGVRILCSLPKIK